MELGPGRRRRVRSASLPHPLDLLVSRRRAPPSYDDYGVQNRSENHGASVGRSVKDQPNQLRQGSTESRHPLSRPPRRQQLLEVGDPGRSRSDGLILPPLACSWERMPAANRAC